MFKFPFAATAALTLASQASATALPVQEAISTLDAEALSVSTVSASAERDFLQGDQNGIAGDVIGKAMRPSDGGVSALDPDVPVVYTFLETEVMSATSTVVSEMLTQTSTVVLNSSNQGAIISRNVLAFNAPAPSGSAIPLSNSLAAVPLPASLPLALLGLGAFAALRRRKST